jgi:hypothetical protein
MPIKEQYTRHLRSKGARLPPYATPWQRIISVIVCCKVISSLYLWLCARICKKRRFAGILRFGVFVYTGRHEGERLDTPAGLARLQGIPQ